MLLSILSVIQQTMSQPLELFVGRPWQIYRCEMERDGTYGNQVTLQTTSGETFVEHGRSKRLQSDRGKGVKEVTWSEFFVLLGL